MELNNRGVNRNIVAVLLILLITGAVYAGTIRNGFVWDDESFIFNWPAIRSFANIPSLLAGSLPKGHEGVYRPLRSLLYVASTMLWGKNPAGYHIQAVLLHLAITFLVWKIAATITRSGFIAAATALLFGLHPIHTENVVFVTASYDLLGIFFFFLSFYFYITTTTGRPRWRYWLSIGLAAGAFASYEQTFALPGVFLLYDLCFRNQRLRSPVNSLRPTIRRLAPYALVLLLFIAIRFIVIANPVRQYQVPWLKQLLISATIFPRYLGILTFPNDPNAVHMFLPGVTNHDYRPETIASLSIWDLRIIGSLGLLTLLIAGAVVTYRRTPIVAFSIVWILITLFPVMNIIPGAVLFAERYLYLPSFGFCLGVAFILRYISSRVSPRNKQRALTLGVLLLTTISIGYGIRTFLRTRDWQTNHTLWLKTVRQTPESASAWDNLGLAYDESDRTEDAVAAFQKSISLDSRHAKAYNNLGSIYQKLDQPDTALTYAEKAIELEPTDARFHANMGKAYQKLGDTDRAIAAYEKSRDLDATEVSVHYLLGTLYMKKGRTDDAINSLTIALRIEPSYTDAANNLGAIYSSLGRYEEAVSILLEAIRTNPDDADLYYNLGTALAELGRREEAIVALTQAVTLREDFDLAREKLEFLTQNK